MLKMALPTVRSWSLGLVLDFGCDTVAGSLYTTIKHEVSYLLHLTTPPHYLFLNTTLLIFLEQLKGKGKDFFIKTSLSLAHIGIKFIKNLTQAVA